DESIGMAEQNVLEAGGAFEFGAIGQYPRGVDGVVVFGGAPATDAVEVFKTEAEWIHEVVASGAGRIGAVLGDALAHGQTLPDCRSLFQDRHVGWRRRWRCAENVVEDPLAANDGRGAGRVGRDGEDAALTEQSAAHVIVAELDLAKTAAVDVGDSVVL